MLITKNNERFGVLKCHYETEKNALISGNGLESIEVMIGRGHFLEAAFGSDVHYATSRMGTLAWPLAVD